MAFWDKITLKTQEEEGQRMDSNHMIGKYRIIIVRELPFADQGLNGKIPKVWLKARCLLWKVNFHLNLVIFLFIHVFHLSLELHLSGLRFMLSNLNN